MNNEQWLEEKRKEDEKTVNLCGESGYSFISSLNEKELEYRKVKALEVIAEELIKIRRKLIY